MKRAEPAVEAVAPVSYGAGRCAGETYDMGATGPAAADALVERVAAAVRGGARTWTEVAAAAGCSRTWATRVGLAAGVALPAEAPRTAVLSVRVAGVALAALDAEAATRGVTRSEAARRLLREALRTRAAAP